MERRLAAILAADMVGYSRLVGKDEAGTLAMVKSDRDKLIEPKILEHKGRIVKLMGDGILAEFPSAVEAVKCAIEIQHAMGERNTVSPEDRRISYRIGVNLGDIMVDDGDILGDGVNIAARLESLSEPGGVCISDMVYRNVLAKLETDFDDLGEQSLKNIETKVRVWRWRAEGAPIQGEVAGISRPRPNADKPSIVILPFVNMSNDPDQEYFADGITEDIITDLSKLSDLRVTARNSSFFYKNSQLAVQQIASELNVIYVLGGSVRKSGENVRITAQLVEGLSDAHIWAERYDRRLSCIFELQDEIASSIVEALTLTISPREERILEKSATRDVDAYESYLRARALLREMTRRSVEHAQRMFKQAVSLDPRYALAYCGLADCASTLAFHYDVEQQIADEAIECSLKALEIDPSLAEAHAAYGQALELTSDNTAAEQEYRTAIELAPASYQAHFYLASLYLLNDQVDRALPLFLKGYELNDHDLQTLMMLASAYRVSANANDLKKISLRTIDISEQRLKINPEDERAAYVGAMALVDLGDRQRATRWADLAASIAVEDSRASYNLACLYGLLEDVEKALIHLEKALKMGCSARKRNWMWVDHDLDSVRRDQRFETLLLQYQ